MRCDEKVEEVRLEVRESFRLLKSSLTPERKINSRRENWREMKSRRVREREGQRRIAGTWDVYTV